MDASCRLARRFLPVVLAVLMAASGCVTVAPGPKQPGSHPRLVPAAARPAVELAEASPPTARTALADTGPDRHREHHRRAHDKRGHDHERGRRLQLPLRRQAGHAEHLAAAEPAVPLHRRQPAAAPKPAHRSAPRRTHRLPTAPTSDMRTLCRAAADDQVNAAIVDLCQDTYGR
ncbi:hypothetical protein ABT052_28815 [Streptomyces sp. NPDC002766]|uniref:hypothetical protein n=1 Tax=Streptomyces sp. NPDC002766 TaxID=3154429 RepID=UPI00332012E3